MEYECFIYDLMFTYSNMLYFCKINVFILTQPFWLFTTFIKYINSMKESILFKTFLYDCSNLLLRGEHNPNIEFYHWKYIFLSKIEEFLNNKEY